jgi:hypothetical protein
MIRKWAATGVVYHHVKPTQLFVRLREERLDRFCVSHIAHDMGHPQAREFCGLLIGELTASGE